MTSKLMNVTKCVCVCVKNAEHGEIIVCLYVDDMLIVGNDDKMITSTKNVTPLFHHLTCDTPNTRCSDTT